MAYLLYLISGLAIFLLSFTRQNYFLEHFENFSLFKYRLIFVLFVLIYWGYYLLYKKYQKERVISRKTLIFISVVIILLFITPPVFSRDIGTYLLTARNFFEFHIDPFFLPLNYPKNPWSAELSNIYWTNFPSPYGPLFLFFVVPAVIFKIKSLFVSIYIYKIIVVGAYLLSVYIFKKLSPKNANSLWLLFALNPAILIHVLVDGHSDVFPMLFLLLSLCFLEANKWRNGLLAIVVSSLVKFNTAIFLPIYWLKKNKFSLSRIITSTLSIMVPLVAFVVIHNTNYPVLFRMFNTLCLYSCSPFIRFSNLIFKNQAGQFRSVTFLFAYSAIFYIFLVKKKETLQFIFWSFTALLFLDISLLTPWYPILIIPIGLLINTKSYRVAVFLITFYSLFHFFGL
jgi:hypothetical protein